MNTRRRMMMLGERWAKEPLVVFEFNGLSYGAVYMNGAYTDKELTKNYIGNTISSYSISGNGSIYFADVTKYRTLTVEAKFNKATSYDDPGEMSLGILKSEYYDSGNNFNYENGDFAVGKSVGVVSENKKTYTFDISKLKGKQRFFVNFHFTFGDYEPAFVMYKIVLE